MRSELLTESERGLNTALAEAGLNISYQEMFAKHFLLVYELDGNHLPFPGAVQTVTLDKNGNLELLVSKIFMNGHEIKSIVFKDGGWWIVQKINIHSSEKYYKVLELELIAD